MAGFMYQIIMPYILSIYKFSLPFVEHKYEKAIFLQTVNDIEHALMYEGIYEKTYKKESGSFLMKEIRFVGGSMTVLYNQNKNFYIPSYQLSLEMRGENSEQIIKNLIKIFTSFGMDKYIFEYAPSIAKYLTRRSIVDYKVLEKDFKKFNYKKIQKFLGNTSRVYLSEKLKNHKSIRNSFNYMIYICFVFYKNHMNLNHHVDELNDLEKNGIAKEYKGAIHLQMKRIEMIEEIGLERFQQYKYMLEKFFNLLSK